MVTFWASFKEVRMIRILAVLLAVSVTASAADVKVLSVGAVQPALGQIAERFKAETGHVVTIQQDTAPGITKRLASGETADILLVPPNLIDDAAKEGKVTASTRTMAARVGIGIAMRRAATPPNVKTGDALKQALLSADAIVFNEGSSGLYLEKLFEQMGIADRLKPKIKRYANGGQVAQHIIDSKGSEIGFVPIPNIKTNEARGLQFVAPLPPDVQNYTPYEAAVMAGSKSADAAREFIRYLTTPAARQLFAAAGVD
jgi:molybdate transport system substrate-binding protein